MGGNLREWDGMCGGTGRGVLNGGHVSNILMDRFKCLMKGIKNLTLELFSAPGKIGQILSPFILYTGH